MGGNLVTEMAAQEIVVRARGCLLGLMVGDALGAPVEGFPQSEIRGLARAKWGSDRVQGFIEAVPMGTFVSAGEPGQYRPATRVQDSNFVPTGPPSNDNVRQQCARYGMYTDDTNAALAVAASIVACGSAQAEHAARSCAEFFRDNEAYRGCPPTAKRVMQDILEGISVEETGLPPRFPFAGGSFANGGGMRISPLAVAYRNADASVLRLAVEATIKASHRHPEAVDFAVVQASAVQRALHSAPADFCTVELFEDLVSRCQTTAVQRVVQATGKAVLTAEEGCDEQAVVRQIVNLERRPGSGMDFQIASVHMAPCVLWAACRHAGNPLLAVQTAIDLGGDTDTTASMVGAIVGALHGEAWCLDLASELENGPHGRDFAMGLAEELASLDVVSA